MESLISKIIKIEGRAQQIVKDAEAEKANIEKDLLNQIEQLHQKIDQMVEIKKEQLIEKAHKEAELKIVKLNKTTEEKLKKMTEDATKNMKSWEDNIYNGIIERV